jgi:hypothetical protein
VWKRPPPQQRAGEDRPVNVLIGAFDREGRSFAYEQGTLAAVPRWGRRRSVWFDDMRGTLAETLLAEGSICTLTSNFEFLFYGYVDIPNYVSELVSLSGIILYTNPAEPTGLLNDPLHAPFAVMPTLRRQFTRSDHVAAWVQISQGLQRPVMPGYVYAEILDENGQRIELRPQHAALEAQRQSARPQHSRGPAARDTGARAVPPQRRGAPGQCRRAA